VPHHPRRGRHSKSPATVGGSVSGRRLAILSTPGSPLTAQRLRRNRYRAIAQRIVPEMERPHPLASFHTAASRLDLPTSAALLIIGAARGWPRTGADGSSRAAALLPGSAVMLAGFALNLAAENGGGGLVLGGVALAARLLLLPMGARRRHLALLWEGTSRPWAQSAFELAPTPPRWFSLAHDPGGGLINHQDVSAIYRR